MPAERRAGPPAAAFQPELATPPWRRRLKQTEAGRVLAAIYRRRRLPVQMLRAPRSSRAIPPADAPRRRVRAVVWIPVSEGKLELLREAWASVQASSPGEVALLVTDDWTTDVHADAVRGTFPDAVVVRPRLPTGGPPRLWPITTLALRAALHAFDFELFLKLDTDALVVGPDVIQRLVEALDGAGDAVGRSAGEPAVGAPTSPRAGLGGAFITRPDGGVEGDAAYHRRVVAGERRHDRQLATWADEAEAAGWPPGAVVQGGCMVLTRAFCDALDGSGALTYVQRTRTVVSEDLLLTMLAYVHGFRAASLGGPDGPVAIANKHLPLPLDELIDPASRWVVTHSTRVGLDGEPEAEILRRARAARERWPARAAERV